MKKVLLVLVVLILSGCEDPHRREYIELDKGIVVIAKARPPDQTYFHYGAFIVTDMGQKVATQDGFYTSTIFYHWYDETSKQTGRAWIDNSDFIKFGSAQPGIELRWRFATTHSIAITHNLYGHELGTHFCITQLETFPDKPLASIKCKYHAPKEIN